jgi:hypothetical protein
MSTSLRAEPVEVRALRQAQGTSTSAQPSVAALRPHWRAVRVTVLGTTSLLLATSAHTFGGGDLPGPGVLAVTAIVLGLLAVPLTGRRCKTGLLLAVLGVQQTLLHLLFSSAAAHPTCEPDGLQAAAHQLGAACGMHGAVLMPMTDAGTTSWAMIIAHALATVATACLLGRGEAWLWRTAERVIRAALGTLTGRLADARPHLIILERLSPWVAPAYAHSAPRGPPAAR